MSKVIDLLPGSISSYKIEREKPPFFSFNQNTEFNQTMDFILNFGLNVVDKYFNGFISWSNGKKLAVFPKAGKQLNAYYDRNSLRFFYEINPVTKKTVYLCQSSDVVTHELGHAVLDAIRPDLWNSPCIEVGALHESFGDILAFLAAFNHDFMQDYILCKTCGDISISNSVSEIAEEMAECLVAMYPKAGRNPKYLRNAVNDFKYIDPNLLPNRSSDNNLSKESHSFSRVMTGSIYDCIVKIYQNKISNGHQLKKALIEAVDIVGSTFFSSIISATLSNKFYISLVNEILEKSKQTEYYDCFFNAFVKRNLVENHMIPLNNGVSMMGGTQVLKLKDFLEKRKDKDLYDFYVEVPYGAAGIMEDEQEIVETKKGVEHLLITNKVGKEKEFEVKNEKLVRNHCSFCNI